jgi:cytochrome c peroxidase
MEIFNSEEANCSACHGGELFTDHGFYNIGQYLSYADPGRQRITLQEADRGRFKVPTLRNISLTAPYMHDGSMATLEEVIDHFASGGIDHPNKSDLMRPFELGSEAKADLIAFLNTLTDEQELDQVK